jgi:hypothetical protein
MRRKRQPCPPANSSRKRFVALSGLWDLGLLVPPGWSRQFISPFGYGKGHLAHSVYAVWRHGINHRWTLHSRETTQHD